MVISTERKSQDLSSLSSRVFVYTRERSPLLEGPYFFDYLVRAHQKERNAGFIIGAVIKARSVIIFD